MTIQSIFYILFLMTPTLSLAQMEYTVRKGDTLLKIADKSLGAAKGGDPRRYEIVKKIKSLNPELKNPNALEPGQKIKIPSDTKLVAVTKPNIETKPTVPATSATPLTPTKVPPTETEAQASVVKPESEAPSSEASEPVPTQEPAAKAEALPASPAAPVAPPPTATTPAAPPPTATATTPPAPFPEKAHTSPHHFFIQPRYQLVEVSTKEVATDTKASLKSNSSLGLDIQYAWVVSPRFHLLFQAGLTQTQFNEIEGDNTPTVNHKSESLTSYAAGIAYEATSTLHFDLMLMQADHTFLIPKTLPEYELLAIPLPGAELNVSWDIYSGSSQILGISAIAEYIGGATKNEVEYKTATETFGALYWKSKRGHDSLNYKVTLSFKNGHQDTQLTKQHEDLSILALGVSF